MTFDVKSARSAGYSDDEIADHLGQQSNFDVPAARKSGYGTNEIIDHLSGSDTPAAQRDLVEGVKPSNAGAGRGITRPAMGLADARTSAKPAPTPVPPAAAPAPRTRDYGAIDMVGDAQGFGSSAFESTMTPTSISVDQKRTRTPGRVTDADIPGLTPWSTLQDAASGALQIGPTVVQGVGELSRLATGDRLGKGLSDFADRGNKSIQEVVGSDRGAMQRKRFEQDMADKAMNPADVIMGNPGALADQVLPTVGSMAIPIGVSGVAGKLATSSKAAQIARAIDEATVLNRANKVREAAAIGATVAQNSASTYSEIRDKGGEQDAAYLGAAISAPASYIAGRLTGGGAEAQAAKLLSGAATGAIKAAPKAMLKEGAQEIGEEVGGYVGETVGTGQEFDANAAGKRLAVAGTLGAVMGGGVEVAGAASEMRQQRIKTLTEAGDTATADLLQKKHDRLTAIEEVDGELQRMPSTPEFASNYRNLRGTGMKPAEAAARSAVTTTFQGAAVAAGIPDAALATALEKANGMPLDEVPAFLQKFTAALEKRGLAQPGAVNLGEQLEAARDDAIEAAMGAVYQQGDIRNDMNDVLAMEGQGTPEANTPEPTKAAPETVRMYHGGEPGDANGPLWFTSDKRNAEGWASKAGTGMYFVDVPKDHPALGGDKEFGVLPPQNIELPAELSRQRKPLTESKQNQPLAVESISPAATESVALKPANQLAKVPKLKVTFGGRSYPVDSINEAQEKWVAFRDETEAGVSEIGNGVPITDEDGKLIARVSYNGRAWDSDEDNANLMAEAPTRSSTRIGQEPAPALPSLAPVTQPAQPVTGEGAGGSQPTQVAPKPAPKPFAELPDLDPEQQQQLESGIAADSEREYQQSIKESIQVRLGLIKPTETDQKKTPFKTFLKQYGIAPVHTSDIAGKNRFKANNMLPATFRAGGLDLDSLVERAIERGFMTEGDRGDQGKLISMIQSEIAGDAQVSTEFADDDAAAQTERAERMGIEGEANKLGLPYSADTSTDQLASMVNRVQRRMEKEVDASYNGRGSLKSERVLANAREVAARIERKRAQYRRDLAQFEQATIAEQDAVLEILTDDDGYPMIVRGADISALEQWLEENQQWDNGYETDSRANKDSGQAGTPVAGVSQEGAGNGAQAGPQEQRSGNGASDQGQEGSAGSSEGLTAPTRADVLAQQERTDNAQALDDRAQIDAEASRQTLTQQVAPEQRRDTSGDMFGEEKAVLESAKKDADAAAKNEASKDPNQTGMFDVPAESEAPVAKIDYAADFAIRPVGITESLMDSGAIKALYKAAGVKTANAFGDLPMESQSNAYAKFVSDGGTPAPAATESYNDKVTRMEREIVVRRLQSDQEVNQANGKPFKTEASAKQFSAEFDLGDTHKVASSGTGYTLQRLGDGQRPSVLKAIAERQANDPEEIRQNAAWAKAEAIGSAADAAVLAYGNGDTSIDEFESALSGLTAADKPATPAQPVTELRPNGTLVVKGDQADILQKLRDDGITKVTPMDGGVMVGKSEAQKALDSLSLDHSENLNQNSNSIQQNETEDLKSPDDDQPSNTKPEALIELRKRESVLKALRKCLAA